MSSFAPVRPRSLRRGGSLALLVVSLAASLLVAPTARATEAPTPPSSAPTVTTTKIKSVVIAPPLVKREDPTLMRGTVRVLKQGVPGVRRVVVKIVSTEGQPTRTFVVSNVLVRAAKAKVVAVGTATSARSARRAKRLAALDSLRWDRLARCESNGIATIVSRNGLYHGLYQFLPSTWRAMGGKGLPSRATPEEQRYRAKLLYLVAGRSPWPYCGRFL